MYHFLLCRCLQIIFEKIMTNSTLDFMMDLLSQAIFEVAKEEGLGECEDEQSKVEGCYSINKYKDGKTKQLVLYADGNVEGFFKVLHENSSEPSEKNGHYLLRFDTKQRRM